MYAADFEEEEKIRGQVFLERVKKKTGTFRKGLKENRYF
jgi:hypothetical protein